MPDVQAPPSYADVTSVLDNESLKAQSITPEEIWSGKFIEKSLQEGWTITGDTLNKVARKPTSDPPKPSTGSAEDAFNNFQNSNLVNSKGSAFIQTLKGIGFNIAYSYATYEAQPKFYEVLGRAFSPSKAIISAVAPTAELKLIANGAYYFSPKFREAVDKIVNKFRVGDDVPIYFDSHGNTYIEGKLVDELSAELRKLFSAPQATITDTTYIKPQQLIDALPISFTTADKVFFTVGQYHTGNGSNSNLIQNITFPDGKESPVYATVMVTNYNAALNAYTLHVNLYSKEHFVADYAYKQALNQVEDAKGSEMIYFFTGQDRHDFYKLALTFRTSDTNVASNPQSFHLKIGTLSLEAGDAINSMGYIILYGGEISTGGFEAEKWDGDKYVHNPDDDKEVVIGFDDKTQSLLTKVLRKLAIGDKDGNTPYSKDNPDPTVNSNPQQIINNFLYPTSEANPFYRPNFDTPTVNNPTDNPSEPPTNIPPNPDLPLIPPSGGSTGFPILPIGGLGTAGHGLVNVYNPSISQVNAFGQWLWTTFSGDIIDTISKLFNDPMDAVVGLHEIYATPSVSGGGTIKAGYLDSGISANIVGNRYTTINCGSIVVPEYYQNYLDYAPYTDCYAYLPFIGIVPLSTQDIVGNGVNITYHVDSFTGCCIALISVARNGYSATVYQFQGNCSVEIPISAGSHSAIMSTLLNVAGAIATENPMMLTAGVNKNVVQHSGSFGSSFGAMGLKKPYIIVRRPTQKVIYNYSQSYGYPAHKMVAVGNCTGYLRAKEVRVLSTTATNVEKEMIVNALKSGIYVK